jgi:hypothetical protein
VEDETDEAVELVLPLLDLKGIGPDTLLWAHALGYYAGNKGLEDRAFILLKQITLTAWSWHPGSKG